MSNVLSVNFKFKWLDVNIQNEKQKQHAWQWLQYARHERKKHFAAR